MEVVAITEVVACSVGGRLCWLASLCGGMPFVHVLSICRPTGCYALMLIHPFLLHVVAIPLCIVDFYPSRLKFEVVDVRVHSEIIYYRKISF